jgi:hypothetical protein
VPDLWKRLSDFGLDENEIKVITLYFHNWLIKDVANLLEIKPYLIAEIGYSSYSKLKIFKRTNKRIQLMVNLYKLGARTCPLLKHKNTIPLKRF